MTQTAPTTRRAGNLPPDATPGEIAAARRRRHDDYEAARAAGALRNGRMLQRGGPHGARRPRRAASARACRGPLRA